MRYADDCNVYVKSLRAGQRVLSALRRCYAKLRLVVNEAKTAVAEVWGRKFLGYRLRRDSQGRIKLAIAEQAMDKVRARLRQITGRTRGRSLEQVVQELRAYVPGWRAYFGLTQSPGVLHKLDSWLRRRLRAVQLKQWKTGSRTYWSLRRLGATEPVATAVARNVGSWWRSSLHVGRVLNQAYCDQLGLPKFLLTSTSRTARCGPACRVVWEGSDLQRLAPIPIYLRTSARPITAPAHTVACDDFACHRWFGGALCRIRFAQVKEEGPRSGSGDTEQSECGTALYSPTSECGVPECRWPVQALAAR